RKIYDEYNDEEIELSKEEIKFLNRLRKGKIPHAKVDPYEPYVDWFDWEDKGHPLSNAPEPKRRFIPSKWEAKKVVKLVRAIRKGWITFEKPKEKPRFYMMWGDDLKTSEKATNGLTYIPAPKPTLPGHEESYNPPPEYIPTQEEINSYQLMYEEDRPKFIPKRYESLRNVPAYEKFISDIFERCLDLYMCPRTRKKRINIDPESLIPKLPKPKDLQPFPSICFLEYKGHTGAVLCISVESSGQWFASGSKDGTVRVWEVETERCIKIWDIGRPIHHIAWNPVSELSVLAIAVDEEVLILNTGLGTEEDQEKVAELLHVKTQTISTDTSVSNLFVISADNTPLIKWTRHEKFDALKLTHQKPVNSISWHHKGDYFATVAPDDILLVAFFCCHFCSMGQQVHDEEYDKFGAYMEEDCGTFDKNHSKDILAVAFHCSYPLFASCSDDCTAHVFHGMVYSDLLQNPLIVPLKVLRGHKSVNGRGILDCQFHPKQPWLFTAGADS
ncbi:hypothetical protein KI387_036809, partial [Taxus chinensis]